MNQKIHIFIIFQYFASILNSIKGFIFVVFLSPEAFGIWRTFYTTINYSRYFDLGISTYSYYRGLITDLRKSYINLIFRSIIILIIPSSIIFSLLAFKYIDIFINNIFIMLITIFFLSFSIQSYASIVSIYKIKKNIKRVVILDMLLASLSLVLSVFLGYLYSINGILIGMTISYILAFIYLLAIERKAFPIIYKKNFKSFKKNKLKYIIPKSFIYYFPGAISVLFINVDLWFGANSINSEIAGYFGLFMGFQILVSIAPSSISTWFYIDDAKSINNDNKKLLKVCIINFFSSAIVATFGMIAAYLVINFFLGTYVQTFNFIYSIFWTLPFFALRNILVNLIIIRNLSFKFSIIILCLILLKVYMYTFDILELSEFIRIIQTFNIIFVISIIAIIFLNNNGLKVKN